MNIHAISPAGLAPTPAGSGNGPAPKDLRQAASEFESLLLGQMLRAARADSEGWFGTGEDQTSASLVDMAEEQVAKAISQSGGLGLARLIETQMQPALAAAKTAPRS